MDADNWKDSIYIFYRHDEKECIVCVMNCREVGYENYEISVPFSGKYEEILNTEDTKYAGCGIVNNGTVESSCKEGVDSLTLQNAPWSAMYLRVSK